MEKLGEPEKQQLLRQLEYYFSDVAYPFDEFLQAQVDSESGAVPAAVISNSPRILTILPDLTAEERGEAICAAVSDSDTVVLVDGKKLKRKYPLPDEDPAASRSVYLNGLPKTADEAELTAVLTGSSKAANFLPVLGLRRLRDLKKDRAFTGQVFVELEDETKAKALVSAANNGHVGSVIKAKVLRDFFESQAKSIIEMREKRAARAAGGETSAGGGEGAKREREEAEEKPIERGLVLHFDGAKEGVDREALSKACEAHGEVAYVNFSRGEESGHVRFKSSEGAAKALSALCAATADVCGSSLSWRSLSEEEEDVYWKEYRDHVQQRKKQRGRGGWGKGKGKGGKGRGRGRS